MSDVTHAHLHSKQSCLIYCLMMSELLRGVEKEAVFDVVLDNLDMEIHLYDRVISALFDEDFVPYDPGAWPARGAAEFSLLVALRAFKESTSFASGIEYAVRIGGDTDTYAAIAGGLLGAYYGYEAIPENWRKAILGHDAMVKYADGLYQMSQRG
jgi:ADP-ribosylglycohydrolase